MAKDSSLYARQALVALLKAAPTVDALVPVARVFPAQRPPNVEWPFIGVGVPVASPFVASCLDGSTISIAVHGYAETSGTGDDTVPGEDMAARIVAACVAVLGGETGAEVALQGLTDCPYPATAYITWTGSQVVQDGSDASAFHGFATFDITVSS